MLSDAEIAETLLAQRGNPLGKAADALVEAAKQQGGVDNITVLLIRVQPD